MTKKELNAFVRELRPAEIEFRNGNYSYTYLPTSNEDTAMEGPLTFHSENYIEKSKNFDIYVHDRYGLNYEHCHDFIEMQYVYSGKCNQTVEDTEYSLKTGDLCFLNTVTRHCISDTNEDDIIVNFLFAPEFFDYRFFGNLGSNDLFSDFFMRSIYQGDNKKRYLIFELDNSERVRQVITDIMCERFDPHPGSDVIIESSLIILFTELLRINHKDRRLVVSNSVQETRMSEIINYIETNYRDITLKSTAHRFGYSPGHLGTLLRKSFSKTFTEILNEIRMMNTAKLLLSTSMPISDIANSVGYSNLSHFYQLFRRTFNVTPQDYRDQEQSIIS